MPQPRASSKLREWNRRRKEPGGWRTVFQLRIAAGFITAGLLVEVVTLRWNHPLSLLIFLGVGGLSMLVGVLIYLWTALTHPTG